MPSLSLFCLPSNHASYFPPQTKMQSLNPSAQGLYRGIYSSLKSISLSQGRMLVDVAFDVYNYAEYLCAVVYSQVACFPVPLYFICIVVCSQTSCPSSPSPLPFPLGFLQSCPRIAESTRWRWGQDQHMLCTLQHMSN